MHWLRHGGLAVLADAKPSIRPCVPAYGTRWTMSPKLRKRRQVSPVPTRDSGGGGIATRYEKTATIYLAGLNIAGIFLWSAR